MKYTISYNHPEKHFIDFELSISVLKKESLVLQLPSWRPGRYELGNFAKNIKDFKILDSHNNLVSFNKKIKIPGRLILQNMLRLLLSTVIMQPN